MRRCDPIVWDSYEYYYTDYYYSDITGNRDLDQDGKYAEYADDELSLDFTDDTYWDEFLSKFTTKSKSNIEYRIFNFKIIKALVQRLNIKLI